MNKPIGWILLGVAALLNSGPAYAVDLKKVEAELKGEGAIGWIHGSVNSQGLYVFTYRNPKDFFDYAIMSLVPSDAGIAKTIEALTRHDKVRIRGSFLDNPSPQKHIAATSIEMVKKYASPFEVSAYEYNAQIPKELIGQNSGTFLVHAIGGEGHILVVEYKDVVLPVYVRNGELTRHLSRNDLVKLQFTIQESPGQPTHLNLNERTRNPVQVLESIAAKHGKPAVIEGALILFPKSPEIIFNIFAVQEELPGGLSRQYTLVNFDDPAAFKRIREKLQAAWDQHATAYVNGRNKLVSTEVRVRAEGTYNEIDANQANPQVLLKDVENIEIRTSGRSTR